MAFFKPNLEPFGRVLRGLCALLCGALAIWLRSHWLLALLLLGSSAFLAFEAVRGWCMVRACGIKTRF
ncbi:MAG: hypothetical protein RLZZ399_1731 [Verrucomicrobiota bacterium]|jgi:hypothetical protein